MVHRRYGLNYMLKVIWKNRENHQNTERDFSMALLLLAKKFLPLQEQIESILRKSSGRLNINNADERKSNQIPERGLKQPGI